MSHEWAAPTPPSRPEDLRSTIDEQVRAFFAASAHVAPIGNVVAGLVALTLLWDHVPNPRLWIWFGFVLALAARQALDARNPEAMDAQLDASGLAFDTNVVAGLVWGALPWLDIQAFGADEVYRWICFGLAFAIGAGSMGGLSVLTGLAMRVQVPLFLLLAAAFVVGGVPAVGAGVVVYLVLMVSDLRGTGRNLRELVTIRVAAADLAVQSDTDARHDTLTGLLNRAGAFERFERLRDRGPFVVMFVDLDHFKEVNDRLGHEAGDRVLVEAAHRIRGVMRPEDVVARLGGDEFLVVFERGDADLEVISQRVLAEVERPITIGADEAVISASIGLTVVDEADWTTAGLLREADHALYEAKRAGRQRIVWFDDHLAGALEERSTVEGELRRAVAGGGIRPVARPAVDLNTGDVSWVEFTPGPIGPNGEVAPEVFLPVAEDIGLIDAVTRSILDSAAQTRLRWRQHPVLGSASVTVRVVASHLMRGGLADDVGAILHRYGLGPGELQLILTETAAIRDPSFAVEAINSMRARGVGIVLGEFGSGKSTLRDLLQLPIDVVTIHPRLVHDAPGAPRLQTLLAGLEHVAGSLGLSVAADGVDTAEQLEVVRQIGLPYAQGDAVASARSPEDLECVRSVEAVRPEVPFHSPIGR